MKKLKRRFISILIVSVLFYLGHQAGSLYAQEFKDLPVGFDGEFYSYQFEAPKGYSKPKWEWVDKDQMPEELKENFDLSPSGLLTGIPDVCEDDIFHLKIKLTGYKPCTEEQVTPPRIYRARLKIRKHHLKEFIELPPAYENGKYRYQLKAPKDYSDAKWKVIDEGVLKEIGMNFTNSGVLFGCPRLNGNGDIVFSLEILVTGKIKDKKCKVHTRTSLFYVKFRVKREPLWTKGENFLISGGIEQSGASSANTKQKVFFELYLSNPLPLPKIFNGSHPQLGRRLRLWGDIKLTSLPQQINDPLVKAPEVFAKTTSNLNINEVARGIEFLAGLDYRLFSIRFGTNSIYSLNLTLAYGATTPINPIDSIRIFEVPQDDATVRERLLDEYRDCNLDLTGKDYIAFVTPDRKNFYRQRYIGFRVKGYLRPTVKTEEVKGNIIPKTVENYFPAVFEVAVGKNDFIIPIDSDLHNNCNKKMFSVLRIGGFYPLRISKTLTLYLFGTALLSLHKCDNQLTCPIILKPAPEDTQYPGENIATATIFDMNRDYYRIGVGTDLRGIIKKIFQ